MHTRRLKVNILLIKFSKLEVWKCLHVQSETQREYQHGLHVQLSSSVHVHAGSSASLGSQQAREEGFS